MNMRRSELLRRASELIGQRVGDHFLCYAQRIGRVDPAPIIAGWQKFNETHLEQLVDYLNNHSRMRREVTSK